MRNRMKINAKCLLLIAAGLALPSQSFAYKIDWDLPGFSWANGTLTKTYTGINGTSINATFTVSGDTNRLVNGYPKLDTDLKGGLTPAEKALRFQIDLADSATESLTLTVTFNKAVSGLNFNIFDIDRSPGAWQDRIELNSSAGNPTLTTKANHTVVGSNVVIGKTNDSPNAGDLGNVGVNFASPITWFSIKYGEGPSSPANPGGHGIAFHDISFVPAPATLFLLAGGLGILSIFRRRPSKSA